MLACLRPGVHADHHHPDLELTHGAQQDLASPASAADNVIDTYVEYLGSDLGWITYKARFDNTQCAPLSNYNCDADLNGASMIYLDISLDKPGTQLQPTEHAGELGPREQVCLVVHQALRHGGSCELHPAQPDVHPLWAGNDLRDALPSLTPISPEASSCGRR